jgi:hypothetical protein
MKTQFMLKPLAFALAAALSAGAFADSQSGGNASITDSQNSNNNYVNNEGTENTSLVDSSLNGVSGNVGVNVAAGDNNQQANAGAIAVADAGLVFGYAASATIDVDQTARENVLDNYSVPNNATLSDSGENASGNVGINIAAGNFNQQKNDMAIAVSETAYAANASVNVSQVSEGNTTNNYATWTPGEVQVTLSGGFDGSYSGQSDQIGNVYPDIWTGDSHPGGRPAGHFDLDSATQGGSDLNDDGGALAFNEAGTVGLRGSVSGFIPVVAGFSAPVVNNASVLNSLNGASGNVGLNVAAGGGNQQSNSLAVAVGCTACAAPSNGGE